jgi:hypothetical protein
MVSPKTVNVIWARAAGRCEYPSCNESLIGDLISGAEDAKFGFIAHIVAEKPTGPRGEPDRSPKLSDDPANLMLLCAKHHKLIDVDELDAHPEQRLLDMKAAHEDRMRIVTDIHPDRASHVLRYGAKIGEHSSPVSFERVRAAMLPDRYPAGGRSIGIQLSGIASGDREKSYWTTELDTLRRQFDRQVKQAINDGEIEHLSVFALAPIPLLVELGRLLGDITPADVYQLHREPAGWKWARDSSPVRYSVTRPPTVGAGPVGLTLSISATVAAERGVSAMAGEAAIWSLAVDAPHNDVIRSPDDLIEFRWTMRRLLDEIKGSQRERAPIHIFPAIPVSIAVELGRVWMPKADLPLLIYDETRDRGFVPRVQIG